MKEMEALLWSIWSRCTDVMHFKGHEIIDTLLPLIFLKFISDTNDTLQHNWIELSNLPPKELGYALNEYMVKVSQTDHRCRDLFCGMPVVNSGSNPDGIKMLVSIINDIDFSGTEGKKATEQTYEYIMERYAAYKGKISDETYSPRSITELMVSLLEPIDGTIYDPCFGCGGTFIQSKKFMESRGKNITNMCYGQEINVSVSDLAKMNLIVHDVPYYFGLGSVFTQDAFKDMTMDYVFAVPPFNMKGWTDREVYVQNDARWAAYGTPPDSNANYAWILHVLSKMDSNNGTAAIVLPTSSLSDSTVLEIRKRLIENDKVEAIISLPAKMFDSTNIPVTVWILNNNKKGGLYHNRKLRDRTGEILFVDISTWTQHTYENRKVRLLSDQIAEVCKIYFDWQITGGKKYAQSELFYAAKLDEIQKNNFNLLPTRYIEFSEKEKILSEPRKPLQDVAEIISVKKILDKDGGQFKVLKKFTYPLNYDEVNYKTSCKIKKGDIVLKSRTFSANLELVYVNEPVKDDVYAPAESFVLRINDKRFNPEFLYLYLTSETFKKYATKYFVGAIAPRLNIRDLQDFPIIIPKSKLEYYERLFKYQQNPLIFNKEYIDILKNKPLNKDIETEFRLEEIKKLASKYNSAAKENYMNDIKEVEACFNAGAYKATLILCGSILEGFLLDWLNELQPEMDWLNQDFYIDKKNNDAKKQYNLNDYINQIAKIKRPYWMKESAKAHEIRKQRNLVHAKLCLKEDVEISKDLCVEVIKYLKEIIDTREGRNNI